jgi:hypothetical protein
LFFGYKEFNMTVVQIGLADKTGTVDPSLLEAAAAAFNIQVIRDVPQFWTVQATVRYLPSASKIPSGVWPVFLVKSLPAGEGGFHLNKHNQPYADVLVTPGSDGWTVAASHEIIEMLVDPAGNRMQSSRSIEVNGGQITEGSSQFEYLVEACDPCEADEFGYSIQSIAVSDFITPHFYDPLATPGTRYSFTGALRKPRDIREGGYISWIDPQQDEWQQLQYFNAGEAVIKNIGPADPNAKSLREWAHTRRGDTERLRTTRELSTGLINEQLVGHCNLRRKALEDIAVRQGKLYR